MTDEELIARLRDWQEHDEGKINDAREKAADRIEALLEQCEGLAQVVDYNWVKHQRVIAAEAKLAKAEAGLLAIAKRDEQMFWGEDYEVEEAFKDMRDIACATLADIQGESHD